MRALGIAIASGLVKGLVLGLSLGLVISYALRWPMPTGSLLGYLAAMAACGTTGIAGGHAPWREGAWLVAALKCVAGVAVGALLYWVLCAHLDVVLPASLVGLLSLPADPALAEDGSLSWVAIPVLALASITTAFGLLVEIDHVGGDDDEKKSSAPKKAASTTPAKKPALARTVVENADTETDDRPARTRRARPSDTE
ncbi:MAG: hypothetical protein J0L92_10425 [Deltaproteobacteria bacterium]|nr:hypothetical protein [Deltaproteobacteria bacterium]